MHETFSATRYDSSMVDEFLEDPDEFEATHDLPTHHYSQATQEWGDEGTIAKLINRFEIDPAGKTATVFGGFTGELAQALQATGFEVIFTDPLSHWVDIAKESGLEAYIEFAETIPAEIIARTDVFATFECYHPFGGNADAVYNLLRFLSAPEGLLFAVSKSTKQFFEQEGEDKTLLSDLGMVTEIFDADRRYRETDGLRIYQFFAADEETRFNIINDARVIGTLYAVAQRFDGDVIEFDHTVLASIEEMLGLELGTAEPAVDRFISATRKRQGELAQYLPSNEFELASERLRWIDST